MVFESVGIVLTDKCNARCRMCCSGLTEVKNSLKTISREDLDLILGQIRDCSQIGQVGVTGGEPMLYPSMVEHILDFDFGREVKIGLKTNGFWGRDPKRARSFLTRYRNRLSNISFSYDEFHREYISLDSIKAIIDIANELMIPTEVVGCFLRDGITPGEILDELGEYAYRTQFKYQPVFKTGLATSFEPNQFIPIYDSSDDCLPCTALRQGSPLITTSLDLYPCCAQVIQNTILKVGNLKDKPLSDLMVDISHNRLLVKLFSDGLAPFLSMVKGEEGCPDKMSAACEACEFVFRDSRYMERIAHAFFDKSN